jgi:hypothetical protein
MFRDSNPSTTPAGPPPSSAKSFTPAGQPPQSSLFGSSKLGTSSPLKPLNFSQQSAFNPSPGKFDGFNSSAFSESTASSGVPKHSVFEAPKQRGFHVPSERDEDYDEEGEEYMDDDEDLRRSLKGAYDEFDGTGTMEEDAPYDEDEDMNDYQSGARSTGYDQRSTSDLLLGTPGAGALVRVQEDAMQGFRNSFSATAKPAIFGPIAKDMYRRMGAPGIEESDDLILETEAIISKLYDEGIETKDDEMALNHVLRATSAELTTLWTEYQSRTETYNSEEYTATIGPGVRASKFAKANFLGGLALNIHHPQVSSNFTGLRAKTVPGVLVEWLAAYHDPYSTQFDEIQVHRPSPANHRLFWGAIFNGLLHGKMVSVLHTLRDAGWRYARSGMDDMSNLSGQVGFTGQSLINIEKVSNAAIQVLSTCPGINGDWNIRGSDWTLFRLRISQALEELKDFAEGRNRNHNESRASDRFGKSSISSYSTIARKAESQVPWNIYQNFLTLYNIVSGDSAAVIANAQDWCEATIGLVLWWDGSSSDKQSRVSYHGDKLHKGAYLGRLRESLEVVTNQTSDFKVNTMNPVEVGLASLFDGDNESVVGFLRAWSGPVSSAVAEVASIGEWLPPAEPQNLINMGSLDDDDEVMGLLGRNNPSPSKVDSVKDQTLIAYASCLTDLGELESSSASKAPQKSREGWELAIAVLGRLDSATRSEEMVGNFLGKLQLESAATVDKLWVLLTEIAMNRHAGAIAEVIFIILMFWNIMLI